MKKAEKYVGNTYNHLTLGRVEVLKTLPKSRTLVEVKLLDRGPGWNNFKKTYTGVKVKRGWMRGQNYQYGYVDEVHYNQLQDISS